MKKMENIHFIHANGFNPGAYCPLLNNLSSSFKITNFLLEPISENKINYKNLKDWKYFQGKFENSIQKNKKIVGIGHSIGGNIILRSCINKPEYFSKIILLDPTLFIPRIIFFWKLSLFLNLHNYAHPWAKATLNRKMQYNSIDHIFKSYRNKEIFSKISDENLLIYIKSITKLKNKKINLTYPKEWEYQIYKTGLLVDQYIWKNIGNLEIPTLIIKARKSDTFLKSAETKINNLNKSNIKIISLDNCTHLFPLEIPNQVSKIISDFIAN